MQMYSGPAGHFWLQPAPNEGFVWQEDLGLTEPGTGRALQWAPGMLGAVGAQHRRSAPGAGTPWKAPRDPQLQGHAQPTGLF